MPTQGTIVATLQQPIGDYFHHSQIASYIGTSYLLSVCCFTPLYGRLSDTLGRKVSRHPSAGYCLLTNSTGSNGVQFIDISELCFNYPYSYWRCLYLRSVRCSAESRRP